MTQVVLIRPGATVYDEQNRVQGILDIPLSDRGRAEVAQLAEKLAEPLNGQGQGQPDGQGEGHGQGHGHELTALYCGPGESVVRTAEIVGKVLGLRPKRIDDLRNLDQGLWQGLQRDEIKRRNLKVFRQWLDDPVTVCPPQGETVENALERIKSALKPLIRRHQDETIGLVVGEPLAQLIACYLRREARVQLDDRVPTGGFECIEIAPEVGRNGS
jgi:broad specificity phosphatase PhoE